MEVQPKPQSIDEALQWYLAIYDSVVAHRSAILSAFRAGTALPDPFFGLTYGEIDLYFVSEQSEVAAMSVVNIVAAAEAVLRADFGDRVQKNFKDPLSKIYVVFYKSLSAKKKIHANFDERGILEKLKASGTVAAHLVTSFRHALRVRHWYAHGRYWLLKSDSAADSPADVHRTCQALIQSLPA